MHSTVEQALNTICQSRDEGDWRSLDEEVLEKLVEQFGEEDLANKLFEEIPRTVPYEVVCDLFDLLAWRTNDNGSSVTRTVESWLRDATDNRQLFIALHLNVYPFLDRQEMEDVLSKLAGRNHVFHHRCTELIAQRRLLNESAA